MSVVDIVHRYLHTPGFLNQLGYDDCFVERDHGYLAVCNTSSLNPVIQLHERRVPLRQPDYLFTYFGFHITLATQSGEELPSSILADMLCALDHENLFSCRVVENGNDGIIYGICLDLKADELQAPSQFTDVYWCMKDYCNGPLRNCLEEYFDSVQPVAGEAEVLSTLMVDGLDED